MSAVLERAAREWEAKRDRPKPILAELRAEIGETAARPPRDALQGATDEAAELLRRVAAADGPAVTVERAGELLHCKRAKVFVLLAEGRLERAARAGRKTLILTDSVHRYLVTPAEQAGRKPKRRRRPSRSARLAVELRSVRW